MNFEIYADEIISSEPIRIIFSNKIKSENEYIKVKINVTNLKGKEIYQVEKFTDKQVFHENIEKDDIKRTLIELMSDYKQLSAVSSEYSIDMRISKKGKIFFSKKEQKNKIKEDISHNKQKNYIIKEGMDVAPLIDLGVFTPKGKVINSKYDKYKQINRFVEIVDDEVKKIEKEYQNDESKVLHILDFGCGKSYLTFILYYYFTEIKKINVKITGLDLKKDVINNCNEIAKKYKYDNLHFELGDINGYKYNDNVDIVLTLHACDTATDYALYNAIKWNAKIIFSVPCCQHEINSTINTSKFDILTKYGLIKEKVSSLFTDAVRANMMEAMGYKTQLLEFIDEQHSPKNILIRSVKSNVSKDKRKKAIEQIERLKEEFNFEQTLYSLLAEDVNKLL
ncbi:class I SAM-dependent methyltransferase [Peptostreptococcus faecalis]|uniref:class I SAM-dependent methyltransferase n=1 Tax=Peptostreptococcus faecalis TaxID=2045015 RepID=UPI000C7E1B90|nr:SAM-dependent methyltransferase [Peptostreptococcus faecalis]